LPLTLSNTLPPFAMLSWQPEPSRRRRIRGEKTGLLQRHGPPNTSQLTGQFTMEGTNPEETQAPAKPTAVALSPCGVSEPRQPSAPQSPTIQRSQDSGTGGVVFEAPAAACVSVAADEQQLTSSIQSPHVHEALTEIQKCQVELRKRFEIFVSDVIARLGRLERSAAIADNSSRAVSHSVKESAGEEDDAGPVDEVISQQVTRQLAVLGDMLRTEVSSASQLAFGNGLERLQGTLKAEVAEHAAVSEAGLIEAKATMAASVERLRETLQHEVGILCANLQGVESRVESLERQSESGLPGLSPRLRTSQVALQESPRCAAETTIGSPRFISATQTCHRAMVSSRSMALPLPQGAGSPRTVTRSRPQERQNLDGLQQRLAGKVSGIVSVLNQSCEARPCQHGRRYRNSSADGGHAAVLSSMPH